MDLIQYFARLFEYDHWANREALASINQADVPPTASMKYINHIIAAQRLWLNRLNGDDRRPSVWPDLLIDQCETELVKLRDDWNAYLADLTEDKLSNSIHYINIHGEAFDNNVRDILTQLLLHGSYHRGQIAKDIRAAGLDPAYTDFIHAIREGYLK